MTVYELTCGAEALSPRARYFSAHEYNDAVVRFSDRVTQFDRDPDVSAAWVHLKRLPDGLFPQGETVAAWTKTSDESPTAEGAFSAGGARLG